MSPGSPPGRSPRIVRVALLLIYEAAIVTLLVFQTGLAAALHGDVHLVIPPGVQPVTIGLIFSLFLPLAVPYITNLKAFGLEVSLDRDFVQKVTKARKELAAKDYEQDRTLYSLVASIIGSVELDQERPASAGEILIAKLNFIESHLVAEILCLWLTRRGVRSKVEQGERSTLLAYLGLRRGQIDLLAGYSGTALRLLDQPDRVESDASRERERLNRAFGRWDVAWLEPLGFENRGYLIIDKSVAESRRITTREDLISESPRLRFGFPQEFFVRPWAFEKLRREGFVIDDPQEVELNDRYAGLYGGAVDVGYGWTTDPDMRPEGRFMCFDLDPSQYVIPVCRSADAAAIGQALDGLKVDEESMRRMLHAIERGRETLREAAAGFVDKAIRELGAAAASAPSPATAAPQDSPPPTAE